MSRFSASRGILYSAPPGAPETGGDDEIAAEAGVDSDADEPAVADD